jgi:hypothetical protein
MAGSTTWYRFQVPFDSKVTNVVNFNELVRKHDVEAAAQRQRDAAARAQATQAAQEAGDAIDAFCDQVCYDISITSRGLITC